MTPEEKNKLLHFCTGSVRAPATGFSSLMGYQGQQQRFTIERDPRGAGRLPPSSVGPSDQVSCFDAFCLWSTGTPSASSCSELFAGLPPHAGANSCAMV